MNRYFFTFFLIYSNLISCALHCMEQGTRRDNPISISSDSESDAEEKPKIIQFYSIDQLVYEESDDNIFQGASMCGLFSTYNGLNMLKLAQTRSRKPIGETFGTHEDFNKWLSNNDHIIEQITQGGKTLGNLMTKHIETLLLQFYNQEKFSAKTISEIFELRINIPLVTNISIIDIKDLPRRGIIESYIKENIMRFRTRQEPQLIILNENGHWLAIVITFNETWVMDSYANHDQKESTEVRLIDQLFRYEPIVLRRPVVLRQVKHANSHKNKRVVQEKIPVADALPTMVADQPAPKKSRPSPRTSEPWCIIS